MPKIVHLISDSTGETIAKIGEAALGLFPAETADTRLHIFVRSPAEAEAALNRALDEPVIQNADWIIHIDVDEFINVRCGNGTLDDVFAQTPEATNIAMTWRLFGHNDIHDLRDIAAKGKMPGNAPAEPFGHGIAISALLSG